MPNESLADAARKYLGVKFHHAGRSAEGGVDCAGIVALALRDMGIPFEDTQAYAYGRDNLERYEACLASAFERLAIGAQETVPLPVADLVVFRYGRVPCHAAILTPEDTIIHVPYGMRAMEEPFSEVWRSRVWSAWRLR